MDTEMNLDHYPTKHIKYKDKKLYPTGKLLKIASFVLTNDAQPTQTLTQEVDQEIQILIKVKDIKWVIAESFGGLYMRSEHLQLVDRFEIITTIELYVYLSPSLFTFCNLKFHNSLAEL